MNRRYLIQRVVLGGTALIIIPSALAGCVKDMTPDPIINNGPGGGSGTGNITADLSMSAYSSLNTSGASLIIQGIIVINTGSGNYVALSSICTHQGCTVGYDFGSDNIKCPCPRFSVCNNRFSN